MNKILKLILLIGLLVLIVISIPFFIRASVDNLIYSKSKNVLDKEFAIVLGAGVKSDGTPGSYLTKRLDDVVDLYKAMKVNKILLTGDNGSQRYNEIAAMNTYIVERGIPQNAIFGDYAGFDTYSSMERAAKIFRIKDAIIVSQAYHLPRAVFIAKNKNINAVGFCTKTSYGKRKYFVREWFATIKSSFDCLINRKAKFYGPLVNTKISNVKIEK